MKESVFVLGDSEPPIAWSQPWEYSAWRAVVLKDETADEELLKALFAERWEPQECYKALLHNGWFKKPERRGRTRRRVMLEIDTVQERIAKAIWEECNRLLVRNMTVEARQFVCETQERAEKAAGIEITES